MKKQSSRTARSARRQAGVGLVEILIAMLIGLFIILGLSSVFIAVRQTFTTQDQLAQLQDEERLALTILTTTLQSAGYFPDPVSQTSASALPQSGNFAIGQSLFGTAGADGASDSVSVRYLTRGGDGIMDCLGQTSPVGPDLMVVNEFTVNAAGDLLCSTDDGVTTTTLVSNVKSLQILYGTDTSNGGNTDRYLNATAVTAGAYWGSVRTARVTLTLVNPLRGAAGPAGDGQLGAHHQPDEQVMSAIARRPKQRGFVMIVGLLMLVVMTVLSISMFRSFGLQERIAGNTREKERALAAAQSALQYGEWWLSSGVNAGTGANCGAGSVVNANVLAQMRVCSNPLVDPAVLTSWTARADYLPPDMTVTAGATGGLAVNGDINYFKKPALYINYLGLAPDGKSLVYQVSGLGYGGSETAAAVVQSTYQVGSSYKPLDTP